MFRPPHLSRCSGALASLITAAGLAQPALAVEFSGSGFATVAIGRTSGACVPAGLAPDYAGNCTRYVADWGHAGVYDNDWRAKPESRLGLQGTASFGKTLSATAQVMARPLKDQQAKLEWLYLNYQPTPDWSIQVGRKRLPLYYYSDFQDVGYAYNTVRPSPDVYGWDIVNYNGISVSNTRSIGDWSLRSEALYGRESTRDNKLLQIFVPTPQKVDWKDIASLNAELSRDWFTARMSYTQLRHRMTDQASGTVVVDGGEKHRLLGLALNADFGNWIVRSEFGTAKRKSTNFDADFYLVNVGYRLGNLTLTGGTSQYHERLYDTQDLTNRHRVLTAALRYEVHKGGALKVQLDRLRERTPGAPLIGDARVTTATYDITF